ncbi:MAG: hypothetical protein IPN69_09070 [Acidobacteria bacterium]|nr:hypothetical protein [Acidobacteriota bacterium]MBK8810865.1 hypothetical protein [Acidobacteriota bacterium]
MKDIRLLVLLLMLSMSVSAQKTEKTPEKAPEKATETVAAADPRLAEAVELARKALAAHGGDKLKNMKTLIVRGSADVSGSPSQTFPATFVTIYSGDKYRFELTNPFQPFKQIYDGEQTVSSVPNFTLPPINRLGLPLLQKLDQKEYVVTALADAKKKNGFRITSPEGYYTDFLVDEKTFEVKSYMSSYTFNDRTVTTSVDIDKLRDVDGVKLPEKYSQRFDLGFATIYSNFKAKDILVNNEVLDDVFSLDK